MFTLPQHIVHHSILGVGSSSTGTVTHTSGALTDGLVVLGAGGDDIKVLATSSLGYFLRDDSTWQPLPAGHDAVTLAGTLDYLTLSGQVLTRNAIDLTTDVTGNLPVANLGGGTGATSSTFWCGDGTWATPVDTGLTGTGTTNRLARWTPSGSVLGVSQIIDNGTNIEANCLNASAGNDYGGYFIALGGNGYGLGEGGYCDVSGGSGGDEGNGGSVGLFGGPGGGIAGGGGIAEVAGGQSFAGEGGHVVLRPGVGPTPGELKVLDPTTLFYGRLLFSSLSADRAFSFPNATGTIALTANKLSAFAATTSSELASVISDENGSGKLIFSDGTLAITAAKTLTATHSLTLAGTDSTTHTFPSTSSSVARIDAAQSFVGAQTFNEGIILGEAGDTIGRIDSAVATDADGTKLIQLKPSVALTSGTGRWSHTMEDSAGNVRFSIAANGAISLFSESASSNGLVAVAGTAATSMSYGIFFSPIFSGAGGAVSGISSNTVVGGFFQPQDLSTATSTDIVGGYLGNAGVYAARAHSQIIGAYIAPVSNWTSSGAFAHGSIYGFKVQAVGAAKSTTATAIYGGFIPDMLSGTTPATTDQYGLRISEQTRATNKYGIWLDNATAGYKAIAIRDANAWIGSAAAAELTIGGTNFRCASTNQGVFGVAAIARPTNAIAAAAFAANTSGIANDTATWGGYTMGQVVQALQNYGVLT